MLKSRLSEYFERSVREDLLTLFNCTASLRSIECSMILQGAQQMSDEVKYRAACVMELMTGQRPSVKGCRIEEEDPTFVQRSAEDQRNLERIKSAMMHRSNSSATAADFRALGNGTQLKSTLKGVKMYDFLEKAREFYLPDVLLIRAGGEESTLSSSITADRPGDYFAAWNPSKLPQYSRFHPAKAGDSLLSTAFLLRSSDLLKFPDIEIHFEALGSGFSAANEDALKLIIRPTLQLKKPLGERQHQAAFPSVNTFGVFNYLLSRFFNPYITRPKLQ